MMGDASVDITSITTAPDPLQITCIDVSHKQQDVLPQYDPNRYSFVQLKTKLGGAGHKLYGRQTEEATLLEAFQRTVADCQQELILIQGQPGQGKTALANTLRPVVATKQQHLNQVKGFFVTGKFEEQAVHEPYEVFITALTEYVDQVLDAADDAHLERIRAACQDAIGPSSRTTDDGGGGSNLTRLIPALNRILGNSEPRKNVTTAASAPAGGRGKTRNYGTEAQNRFRHTFCHLVRSLARTAPLVLFLDDLQWADTASVELVRNLMHSPPMPLLILGAHRCDMTATISSHDSDPTRVVCIACMEMKPFVATMQDLEKERVAHGLRMRTMDLKNLEADAVTVLLQDLLDHKMEHDPRPLAEWIVDQTDGNIFHILQFVRLLLDQGFLRRNDQEKWSWDSKEFNKWSGIDDNLSGNTPTILELVQKRLAGLPRLSQEALKVASCLGDEIDDSALDRVLQTATSKYLEQAAAEGLLVFVPSVGGYRFAHDWIRQAAFDLTPPADREEFHLRIGRKLWKSSSAGAIDKNIFVVVSLLNKGIPLIKEERERYKVAELNLHAAEKAAAVSAFPDASKFARKGIRLLGGSRWRDFYDLTLSLYSLAAEVEAINGEYERVVIYIEDIVQHAACLEDKLQAYAALIRSMGAQDNVVEAITVGVDVLGQLGEPFPSKPPTKLAVIRALLKVKLALRGRSNQDILNLPLMQDSIKIATLQILNLLVVHSYKARSLYTPLLTVRAITLTLRYGLHEASSVAFAVYGGMLCGLDLDYKAGKRYGEVGISIADKLQSRVCSPMVQFVVGSGIHHWTAPIAETYGYLVYASRSAMEIGDVEIAGMAKVTKCAYSFLNGEQVEDCIEKIVQCISITRVYRKQSVELLARIHLQFFECFLEGKAPNPARLAGASINFDQAMKECVESNTLTWVACLYLYGMELAYSFRDYEYANTMAENNRDLEKAPSAMFFTVENRYKEALIAVAMARMGKDASNNKSIAKANLKKMEKWARNSRQSYHHKFLLMDAELQSLKGSRQKDKVYSIYEQAISHADKLGYRNEVALIFERYADFKQECGDQHDATALYRKSINNYSQWGATAKASQLQTMLWALEIGATIDTFSQK